MTPSRETGRALRRAQEDFRRDQRHVKLLLEKQKQRYCNASRVMEEEAQVQSYGTHVSFRRTYHAWYVIYCSSPKEGMLIGHAHTEEADTQNQGRANAATVTLIRGWRVNRGSQY